MIGEIGALAGGLGQLGIAASTLTGGGPNRNAPSGNTVFWRTYDQSKRQFRQQMDEVIQRRVADARKAGVHPLYALGMSGASPTASVIPGQSSSGSFKRDGLRAIGQAGIGVAEAIESRERSRLLRAQTQHQQMLTKQLRDSEEQKAMASADAGNVKVGMVKAKPAEVVSAKKGDPSTTAGVHPGWKDVKLVPGMPPLKMAVNPDENMPEGVIPTALTVFRNLFDLFNYAQRQVGKSQRRVEKGFRKRKRTKGSRPSSYGDHILSP